LNNSNSFN